MQNILGDKVQTCLMYFGRDEHQDNLNTIIVRKYDRVSIIAEMILDSKSVCRTSGSTPVDRPTSSTLVT